MTTNAPPSRNPADNDSLAGLMRVVTRKLLQNTDDMLPARVIAYDRTANVAQVQPLINVLTTDGQQTGRAQVAAVPVLQLGGGGFLISFPVETGDLGWIKANDRDVSLFRQFHAASAPNTYRMHSFEDAMFIPDTMLQGVTIAAEDEGNAVFQNLAGTVRLALWNALLKITAPNACITDTAGYAPSASALLDLNSTTKAVLFPRLSTAQKNAIPSPRRAWWSTTPTSGRSQPITAAPGVSMVQTFGQNANGDVYIGSDGNLVILSGLPAVEAACATASLAQLGEEVLTTGNGLPNFQAVWVGARTSRSGNPTSATRCKTSREFAR